jgi:hypothetical protein
MSYDFKLAKTCDNKVIYDDHIVESDFETVRIGMPIVSPYSVKVRINDFERSKDFKNEILLKEDVSNQVTGTNKTFFVSQGPIFNGLKLGQLATRFDDVIVRIKVVDENAGYFNGTVGQFTGVENFFYTQGKPLLKSNDYDFNSLLDTSDVTIKVNDVAITVNKIQDFDAKTGRIQLTFNPLSTDKVTISYYYRAKIAQLVSLQSRVTIKQTPLLGQEVKIAYYSSQSDGWSLVKAPRTLIPSAQDIVFDRGKKTNRFFIQNEDVTFQFKLASIQHRVGIDVYNSIMMMIIHGATLGEIQAQYPNANITQVEYDLMQANTNTQLVEQAEKAFKTRYSPILPLNQVFANTYLDTLNNAAVVMINGVSVPNSSIDSKNGIITLYQRPDPQIDVVTINYYYQTDLIPDRISIDYYVESTFCNKCSDYSDFIEYTINSIGQYITVRDEAKLVQDLKKIVITRLGSDPIATWYGTDFSTAIGTKVFPDITKTKIGNQLYSALSNLKAAQIKQEEYQTVTDREFLNTIQDMSITQDTSDPSLFFADINILNQSNKIIPTSQSITLEG